MPRKPSSIKQARQRQAQHARATRTRLVEQGLTRVEAWVSPDTRARLLDVPTHQRGEVIAAGLNYFEAMNMEYYDLTNRTITSLPADMDEDDRAQLEGGAGWPVTLPDGSMIVRCPMAFYVDDDGAAALGGSALSTRLAAALVQGYFDRHLGAGVVSVGVHNTTNGGGWEPTQLGEYMQYDANDACEGISIVLADVLPMEDDINTASQAAFDEDRSMALIRDDRGQWRCVDWEDPAADRDAIRIGGSGVEVEDQLTELDHIKRLCRGDEWPQLLDVIGDE